MEINVLQGESAPHTNELVAPALGSVDEMGVVSRPLRELRCTPRASVSVRLIELPKMSSPIVSSTCAGTTAESDSARESSGRSGEVSAENSSGCVDTG